MMKRINILVKTTESCNLRCKYCFHEKYGYDSSFLSIDQFQKAISILSIEYDSINIVWHGGEPLLADFDFFMSAYEICRKKKNTAFTFSIQTNATLLNDEIIDFFIRTNTRIGISFDGLDNQYMRGHTQTVLDKVSLLKSLGLKVGAIMVVTQRNVSNLFEEYKYFKKLDIGLKINPLFMDGAACSMPSLCLNTDDYIEQMVALYKFWLRDTNCLINVSNFSELTKLVLYKRSRVCTFNSCVGKWLCLDAHGDVYPCDRLCLPMYLLGNIEHIKHPSDLFINSNFKRLLQESISRRKHCIDNCEYYSMCYSGCNASALLSGSVSTNEGSFFCKIQRGLLTNLKDFIIEASKDEDQSKYNPLFLQLL